MVAERGELEWKVSKPSLLHLREIEKEKGVIGSEMKMISGECLRIMFANALWVGLLAMSLPFQ